jgi:hypothetical protein
MKSSRDDLIDRMKTGWGCFVLASNFVSQIYTNALRIVYGKESLFDNWLYYLQRGDATSLYGESIFYFFFNLLVLSRFCVSIDTFELWALLHCLGSQFFPFFNLLFLSRFCVSVDTYRLWAHVVVSKKTLTFSQKFFLYFSLQVCGSSVPVSCDMLWFWCVAFHSQSFSALSAP